MASYFSGSETKSKKHADKLAKMLTSCVLSELVGFSAQKENRHLYKYLQEMHGKEHPFWSQDGWHETGINIHHSG